MVMAGLAHDFGQLAVLRVLRAHCAHWDKVRILWRERGREGVFNMPSHRLDKTTLPISISDKIEKCGRTAEKI
jgi:hypothetical protein